LPKFPHALRAFNIAMAALLAASVLLLFLWHRVHFPLCCSRGVQVAGRMLA